MIADEDLYASAIYLFVYLFLFGLGIRMYAIFMFLAGIVGIFFSLEILRITGSVTLATIFIAVSVFTIILGVARVENLARHGGV